MDEVVKYFSIEENIKRNINLLNYEEKYYCDYFNCLAFSLKKEIEESNNSKKSLNTDYL